MIKSIKKKVKKKSIEKKMKDEFFFKKKIVLLLNQIQQVNLETSRPDLLSKLNLKLTYIKVESV
jgi:hypothetical protein